MLQSGTYRIPWDTGYGYYYTLSQKKTLFSKFEKHYFKTLFFLASKHYAKSQKHYFKTLCFLALKHYFKTLVYILKTHFQNTCTQYLALFSAQNHNLGVFRTFLTVSIEVRF